MHKDVRPRFDVNFKLGVLLFFLFEACLSLNAQELSGLSSSEGKTTQVGSIVVFDTSALKKSYVVLVKVVGENGVTVCRDKMVNDTLKQDCLQSNVLVNRQFNTYLFTQTVKGVISSWSDIDPNIGELDRQISEMYEDFRIQESTLNELDQDKIAAEIYLNEEVYLWRKIPKDKIQECINECDKSDDNKLKKKCKKDCSSSFSQSDKKFIITKGLFYIRRGYISSMEIRGYVQGDKERQFILTNPSYKLSFYQNDKQFFTLDLKDKDFLYAIKPSETFDLRQLNKADKHFQDRAFALSPGTSTFLNRMGVNDYLSINVASDALGLNLNNSSGFLRNSFALNLPLNMKGRGPSNLLPYFQTGLSYFVINGEGANNGYREIESIGDTLLFVDFFDFIRYQNVQFNLEFGLFAFESKKYNLTTNIAVGQKLFRSGFNYTRIDATTNKAVSENFNEISTAFYFKILFQYRPASNLGADLIWSLNKFGRYNINNSNPKFEVARAFERGASGEPIFLPIEDSSEELFYNYAMNAYARTGNKAGVFAELSADISFRSNKDGIFPSLLIGYSTNLNAYVSSKRN